MYKKLLFLLFTLFSMQSSFAQLNMSYVSNYTYDQTLSDIWGYVAPDGTEYALVGLKNGVSILSLEDPASPVEVAYLEGVSSNWRDVKTWDEYAYVTNETGNGLMVIDLTNLPASASSYDWEPDIPGIGILDNCHNIYIDEFGYAYLAGCSELTTDGNLIIDVFTDPSTPAYVAACPNVYSHDIYVRDNLMYASEIYAGIFTIYDVTDKNNIQTLGSQSTPYTFTHNTWPSDDSNTLFTTDEQGNAPVASYDISDPSDIQELDQFYPLETLGEGVIPHNVHVWEDWIIISYYTDGCLIIDGSNPENLIEVGNFDTYIPNNTGFDGAWGAYPYLPSGLVLVSDIGNGCYILEPNYVRACWLEGTVTDITNGNPINNATIEIQSSQLNATTSDPSGEYKTGQATSGSFDVVISAVGYYPATVQAILVNGEIVILDVELTPIGLTYVITGQVLNASGATPIANALIYMRNNNFEFTAVTDGSGFFLMQDVAAGNYEIFAGKWGFVQVVQTQSILEANDYTIYLNEGYSDDFIFDYQWTSSNNASSGLWELGEPVGTIFQDNIANPDFDVEGDVGDRCYVTGNAGGNAGDDDLDGGPITLTSPIMNLLTYDNPTVQYRTWFFDEGNTAPDDNLIVKISNGTTEAVLETISTSASSWNPQSSFVISDYVTITSTMQIIFETSDVGQGHVLEAAVDAFRVTGASTSSYPGFSSSGTSGCIPLTVEYSDPSDSTTTFNWSFPGGSPATSTNASQAVTYSAPGVYNVTLVATTVTGNTFVIDQQNYIVAEGPPTASFDYVIGLDGEISFFNTSSSSATNFTWEFGDGQESTDENPVHVFGSSNIFTVELIASNACGGYQVSEEILIQLAVGTEDIEKSIELSAFPNPFSDALTISYSLDQNQSNAKLNVYNVLGQKVEQINLLEASSSIEIGSTLGNGIYLVQIEVEGILSTPIKVVKN